MSRIARKPIVIPAGTELSVADSVISVKGPKGELKKTLHTDLELNQENGEAQVVIKKKNTLSKMLLGTFSAHVRNMISGVNEPFKKVLVLEGVGYKMDVSGDKLVLNVGFSHPVEKQIPEGINATVQKNVLTVEGADKELVGQFAAEVRDIKRPEPYKGKGIRYEDEVVRRKQGKKAV